MKRCIVTGAAGFIGAHIASRLLQEGYAVIALDNLSTGKIENVPAGAEFIEMNVGDATQFHKLEKVEADVVFHLAGQSSGETSFLDPEYDFQSHVQSTFHLLQFCKAENIQRFLYASSMSVYGDTPELPVKEDGLVSPKTYYGAGKAAAERYIQLFQNLGMDTTILRFFNVYGPGQNMENMRQGMVSIYMAYMLRNEPVTVKGAKERFRDFIYIDDLVDAWMKAWEDPVASGRIYNLCSGKKTTVEELLQQLRLAYGDKDYPVTYSGGTPGDQFGIYGCNERIKADLDWQPSTNLEQGLRNMLQRARAAAPGVTDE